jgi:hypothetical protein
MATYAKLSCVFSLDIRLALLSLLEELANEKTASLPSHG